MIYENIEQLIGKTPILHLKKLKSHYSLHADIFAKLECFNPTGSAKDRAALGMILAAEEKGIITPGATIIEPTSGNTGIALAAISASRGYKCVIVMPSSMSKERIAFIKAFGGEVVLSDASLGMLGATKLAEELHKKTENSFIPSQFENPENKHAHFTSTGPEIYSDLDGKVDIFVSAVGTGGTISGVGEYLKSMNKNVKVIAVEPEESPLLSEGKAGAHKIQGIGANFIPEVLNRNIYDEIIKVSSPDAYTKAREAAKLLGIGVGISSGAALSAAIALAKRKENEGKNIVVLLPDSVDRYLSTDLFD